LRGTGIASKLADAAVARAAHDAMAALWPAQKARFDGWLANDLAGIPAGRAKWNGIELGRHATAAILALRANDNSAHTIPSNEPGRWRPDPVSMSTAAVGVAWGHVRPFAVPSVDRFNLEGIEQGNRIVDYVFDRGLVPPGGCGCR